MKYLLNSYRCFKIVYTPRSIYISNFKKIISIDSERIIIDSNEGFITIKGSNIISNRLVNNEAIFNGNFKEIIING